VELRLQPTGQVGYRSELTGSSPWQLLPLQVISGAMARGSAMKLIAGSKLQLLVVVFMFLLRRKSSVESSR
jgi:hypothetical protein